MGVRNAARNHLSFCITTTTQDIKFVCSVCGQIVSTNTNSSRSANCILMGTRRWRSQNRSNTWVAWRCALVAAVPTSSFMASTTMMRSKRDTSASTLCARNSSHLLVTLARRSGTIKNWRPWTRMLLTISSAFRERQWMTCNIRHLMINRQWLMWSIRWCSHNVLIGMPSQTIVE